MAQSVQFHFICEKAQNKVLEARCECIQMCMCVCVHNVHIGACIACVCTTQTGEWEAEFVSMWNFTINVMLMYN